MLYLEACIEKHYLKFLIFMFVLGWLYMYYGNKKNELAVKRAAGEITDYVDDYSWFPF